MPGVFLRLFKPFIRVTPEIKQPEKEISFRDKIIYTFVVLIVYIIMSNVPLYLGPNASAAESTDYYYWLRVILASQRGTLTELGIGPIVTAGLVMQLLQGSKLIQVNMADPLDRALFTGAQKVIAVLLTLFQTAAYIWGEAYGPVGEEGLQAVDIIIIFFQLFMAGQIIILLDEILQKGYGLGSGVSLFIAAGVAGQIFWNCFSYIPESQGDGLAKGIIVAFFSLLFKGGSVTNGDVTYNMWDLFIREANAPGIMGLVLTVLIFFVVIYVESMRVEIPLTYAGYKGYRGKYPMKLLYVSNIPVILAQALYANILFFGQLLSQSERVGGQIWVNWLGTFEQVDQGGNLGQYLQPTGGLAYYLTAPQGLSALINGGDTMGELLLHSVIYLVLFIGICIGFGKIWVEVSGLGPRDIAGQIINSKMQIPGFRRSEKVIEKILKRYIPTLTTLCGIIVGVLSFSADFLGALTTGTGLLLSVGIIQNYAETISREVASDQMGGLGGLLGV